MIRDPSPMRCPRAGLGALGLGALLASPAARADGLSLDPEILQGYFSERSLPGVDRADIAGEGAVRLGTLLQYEQNPLVLYQGEDDRVTIVHHRADAQFGASYDWSKRFSSRVVIPVTWQSDGDVPTLAADGFGMRDMVLGGRAALASSDPAALTVRLDLRLPTGSSERYLGEDVPSVELGFLGRVSFGPMELLADAAFAGRKSYDTEYDLVLGPEAIANVGLRHTIQSGKLSLGVVALNRLGARTELGGGARSELVGAVQAWPMEGIKLDFAIGHGLTHGPGTTTARALAGVTWFRPPKKQEILSVPGRDLDQEKRPKPKAELLDDYPEKEEDIAWKDGELARVGVDATRIVIRDPIQFELATQKILPTSLPVLEAVAELMASYWQIDHLIVEGHASEEGNFDYNYDLSLLRARAVYQALVEAGVHPARLSFRGFGEVKPRTDDATPEHLALNRRVEFHILRLLDPLEPPPTYPADVQLPWSGQLVPVRTGTERLVGGGEVTAPVGPNDDQQALDLLHGYLKDEDGAEAPAPPPPRPPPPRPAPPPEPEEEEGKEEDAPPPAEDEGESVDDLLDQLDAEENP